MYFARVLATTSGGSAGGGLFLSQPLVGEPVADELLVERRLAAARLVLVGRPEPRAVGRQHFVDQNQLAVDLAELELRVGDDDAAAAGRTRRRAGRCRGCGGAAPRPARGRRAGTSRSNEMFSSCSPTSALVAGVKIGSGSWSLSRRPGGSAMPQTVPSADTPSSPSRRGSRARRTRSARPRSCARAWSGPRAARDRCPPAGRIRRRRTRAGGAARRAGRTRSG